MKAHVSRTTPSGYGSFTLIFNQDHEPKAVGTHSVRLAKWEEHTGTVEVLVAHEDVPAYAAALLAEYVKIEARRAEEAPSTNLDDYDFGPVEKQEADV